MKGKIKSQNNTAEEQEIKKYCKGQIRVDNFMFGLFVAGGIGTAALRNISCPVLCTTGALLAWKSRQQTFERCMRTEMKSLSQKKMG